MYLLGLTKRPSGVVAPESYGSALNSNTAAFSYQSTGISRDQSVSFTRNYSGRIYLRVTGGKAIMFDFDGSLFDIYLVSGLSESAYDATTSKKLHFQGAALGGTIVVGCAGFDIYVIDDGVEIVRFKSIHHTAAGRVACKELNGQTRSAGTVTFAANATLYSDPPLNIYDPRDFGAASVATTGTISASSTTLTVASATGFAVGDHVIVEIGAESGAGARGTKGVGGTWPALSYANAAARAADTGQVSGTYAWQIDTGNVYRWQSSTWTQQTDYYIAKAVPRALQARITGISGSNLTLSVAATVTATNANVYLDCTPAINLMTYNIWYKFGSPAGVLTSFLPSSATIRLPAGTFYLGGKLNFGANGIPFILTGAGDTTILKSPKGTSSASISVASHASQTVVSSLKMIGNARDTGFGLDWDNVSAIPYGSGSGGFEWDYQDGNVTEIAVAQGSSYPPGIYLDTCTSCEVQSVTSVDIFQKSVGTTGCASCWARDCSTTMTDGLRQYIQWAYQIADSTGGGIDSCTVTSPRLIAGFETFRSSGVTITDCTGNNASYSSNSSGDFDFTNCTCAVTVTDNVSATTGFSEENPMFNINSNISPPDASMILGGTLTNCVMTQASRIDTSNNSLRGIVVNLLNPNIAITGGSYTAPDYLAPSTTDGACGVNSTGTNTDVTSFTVTGKAKHEVAGSGLRNIDLTGGGGSSATSCTANEIYVNP